MGEKRKYSSWRRPFRLQLSVSAAVGFDAVATLGSCETPGCGLFEWCRGARYCRDCWLQVYGKDRLPERWGYHE
ncbi:hypothetical protein [Dictyobacter kobayashii]|uniref:hypothetical protein n=1 Tax=Dictyobacter kobayashii TaxID=2014872 RepID=UPI000F81680F|nr:hypothetical protein [Dictyobacter kobayashii]